jgi:hypothetical protein
MGKKVRAVSDGPERLAFLMKNKCNFSPETPHDDLRDGGELYERQRCMIKQIIIHGAQISMNFTIAPGCGV